MHNPHTSQRGFSLIELLIVVAIIGIIAAIAIPNILASKRAANEGSAIASLRTLTGAEATYQSTIGASEYGTLVNLRVQGLVDSVLGTAPYKKSDYIFDITPNASSSTAPATFDATSRPTQPSGIGTTGTRSFYTNESGVIYFSPDPAVPPVAVSVTDRAVTGGTPLR